jgi:hypothetical protein
MNEKKVRLAILKELDNGNRNITHLDFQINEDQFEKICNFLEKEELVDGIDYYWQPRVDFSNAHLTIKGEKYLSENSTFMKTYKGIKEFRDWLPF